MDNLMIGIIVLCVINLLLLILLFFRKAPGGDGEALGKLQSNLQEGQEQLRRELLQTVEQQGRSSLDSNERLSKLASGQLQTQLQQLQQSQGASFTQFKTEMGERLGAFNTSTDTKLKELVERITSVEQSHEQRLESIQNSTDARTKELVNRIDSVEQSHEERLERIQNASAARIKELVERIDTVERSNEERLERIRGTVEQKLGELRQDNAAKLEEMRQTVDEKLQSTLEKRLSESFNTVSQELERVHAGIGAMRNIADDVGGLKKMLGNVKTRGNIGEVQLESIIADILTKEQYETNVVTVPHSTNRVEFAIRMPGQSDKPVLMPIDAKFPGDTYSNLLDARESGDAQSIKDAQKKLQERLLGEAKDIHDKYLEVPYTTDFGVLFLPSEGLFAEAQATGIADRLRQDYQVVLAGPGNMAALLSALRMGFRGYAIQKRSEEVWQILGAAKSEFAKFGEGLQKMRNHLDKTSDALDNLMTTRTRAINRKLSHVQSLETGQNDKLLELEEPEE